MGSPVHAMPKQRQPARESHHGKANRTSDTENLQCAIDLAVKAGRGAIIQLAQLPQFGVRDADFMLLLRGGDTVFSFCSG